MAEQPPFTPVAPTQPGLPPEPVTWTQPDSAAQVVGEEPGTTGAQRSWRPRRTRRRSGSADAPTGPSRRPALPAALHGPAAAPVIGLLVGLAMVSTTALVLRGCDAVRGTATCGGGPGFFLLIAVLVLAGLLGSFLLRLAGVQDPGGTSVLAVGLTSVVAVVLLSDQLLEWWMLLVIPPVAAGAFALSRWVTTTYAEDDPRAVEADAHHLDVEHRVR